MLTLTQDELRSRAEDLKKRLEAAVPGLQYQTEECEEQVGGGAAPLARLKGYGVSVYSEKIRAEELEASLRNAEVPVIVRVFQNKVHLDMRTIGKKEESLVIQAFKEWEKGVEKR